jgi:hypothetical protein
LWPYLGLWQLLGTAPRTISFEIDRWHNESWGLHNIVRDQIAGTVMVSIDGSRANNVRTKHYEHYFIPSGDSIAHRIHLRPANVVYEVDDKTRTATLWRCTCTWEEPQQPAPDAACISAAHAHLGASVTQVRTGEVAGASVIWYRKTDSNDDDEAAFAPKLGCDVLEQWSATYNAIGLPTSRFHFVVRSYAPGSPAPNAFTPPPGYTVREKPL